MNKTHPQNMRRLAVLDLNSSCLRPVFDATLPQPRHAPCAPPPLTRARSPSHMRQLFELCNAPSKKWRPLPMGDHNSSVLEDGYFEAMAEFVAEVTGAAPVDKAQL